MLGEGRPRQGEALRRYCIDVAIRLLQINYFFVNKMFGMYFVGWGKMTTFAAKIESVLLLRCQLPTYLVYLSG